MASKDALLLNGDAGRNKGSVTTGLLLAAAVGSMGSAQYGFNIGVINLPQNEIQKELHLNDDPFSMPSVPMIVALFCIGGWVGSAFSPQLVDRLGRKAFLVHVQWFFVLGGALCCAVNYLKSSNATAAYAVLLVARVLFGLGSGAASVAVPMYLGEIASPEIKGALGAINQFQIVVWILLAQLLGLGMSSASLWAWMMAATGFIGLVTILLSFTMVESPRWLVSKGKRDEARKVLVKIRGYEESDADDEIMEIEEASAADNKNTDADAKVTLGALLKEPMYRKPLMVAVVLQLTQQLSGINAVFFYSTSFFQAAFPSNSSIGTIGTIAVGAINALSTAASMPLIEKAGRKPLLLWAIGGMLVCAGALTASLVGKDADASLATPLAVLSIVFVNLYVVFFEIGLGAIPWSIGGEMFPEAPRATAMSVAAAANWIANTLVALYFKDINNALGNYSFLPFCAWLAGAFVFTLIFVPETKGKSPAELLRWFNRGYAPADTEDV